MVIFQYTIAQAFNPHLSFLWLHEDFVIITYGGVNFKKKL